MDSPHLAPLRWPAAVLAVAVGAWIVAAPPTQLDSGTRRAGRRTSGALEALDLWAAARAYPEAVIPDQGFARAFEQSRLTMAGSVVERGTEPWQPLGPHNIGGRTLAVAFNPQNPNTVWAGSASGGVWRSFTGGVGADAWDRVVTGQPVLGVSSIVFAPGDSTTILIGTGEVYGYQSAFPGVGVRTTRGSYGIGILKSTDGGVTWSKSLDWSYNQRRGVASLAAHPSDAGTVYAGTTEGTYKTTDGGASWNLVHPVLMAMHVVVDPAEPERVYVACGDHGSPGHGLYRTENGGVSWAKLTAGLPASWTGKAWLDIYDANPNVIYASLANEFQGLGLYRSLDHGDSWMRISSRDYAQWQGWYSHWVSVDPGDSSIVLTGGIDIWRSTTGGTNLQRRSVWSAWYFGNVPPGGPEGPPNYAHADHHAVVRHPTDPSIVYFGTDGGVFRSLDGGQTFAGANGGYATTQFYNGFSSAFVDPLLAIGGMQDNATAIYEGTVGWRRVIGGDGCWTAIHPLLSATLFASTQNLAIRKSTDLGEHWSGATAGIGSDPVAFVAPFVLSFQMPDVMYAGRSIVYKSTNGAGSWLATNAGVALDGNPVLSLGLSWVSSDIVYAATAPLSTRMHVFVTTNGGATWDDVTGPLPDRYPLDVAVAPNDPATAYVALGGFGASHLWRTTDTGASWEDLGGDLPDLPAAAVAVDPDHEDHVYFGNDLGVYVSTDAGASWQEFQTGMAPAMVFDLSVNWLSRTLRVATHGSGVFERPLVEPATGVVDELAEAAPPATAPVVRLLPNVPNPFNPTTGIRFALSERRRVRVSLVAADGRRVATLADGVREAGLHTVRLDAGGLASGVYLVRVEAGDARAARKIVLAR